MSSSLLIQLSFCFVSKNLMSVFSSWAQAEQCRESVICSGDEKKFVVTKIFLWWRKYFLGDWCIFLAWNIFLVMEAIVRWLNEVFFWPAYLPWWWKYLPWWSLKWCPRKIRVVLCQTTPTNLCMQTDQVLKSSKISFLSINGAFSKLATSKKKLYRELNSISTIPRVLDIPVIARSPLQIPWWNPKHPPRWFLTKLASLWAQNHGNVNMMTE